MVKKKKKRLQKLEAGKSQTWMMQSKIKTKSTNQVKSKETSYKDELAN